MCQVKVAVNSMFTIGSYPPLTKLLFKFKLKNGIFEINKINS
jgi:hypothetical protein